MAKDTSSTESLSMVVGSLGRLIANCDQSSFDRIIVEIGENEELDNEALDGFQRLFDGLDEVAAGVWRRVQPDTTIGEGRGNG